MNLEDLAREIRNLGGGMKMFKKRLDTKGSVLRPYMSATMLRIGLGIG